MLKSTAMKIEAANTANSINRERNNIERERIAAEMEIANLNASTRDRVDISLKEYNEMQETIKNLNAELDSTRSYLNSFLRPLRQAMIKDCGNFSPDKVGYVMNCITNNEHIRNISVRIEQFGFEDPLTETVVFSIKVEKTL